MSSQWLLTTTCVRKEISRRQQIQMMLISESKSMTEFSPGKSSWKWIICEIICSSSKLLTQRTMYIRIDDPWSNSRFSSSRVFFPHAESNVSVEIRKNQFILHLSDKQHYRKSRPKQIFQSCAYKSRIKNWFPGKINVRNKSRRLRGSLRLWLASHASC